ncbi:MAG: methyltransferase [Bacteroides sp.]|nr:methyltransferase [Roseburia sp.]MCM1346689.1 methyltransferase [Bacteroides sp.]MCM1421257.1 methyltransferase [Bacteroides sp.]
MSTPFFKFKKFTVWHDKCGMKVGTDGVLLGAWCNVSNATNALDMGSGSGLIALMIAQRNSALQVDAIDIDADAVEQASENIKASIYSQRIRVVLGDITQIGNDNRQGLSEKYALIVSNPPFYKEDVHPTDSRRNNARHTSSLPFSALIEKAADLLDDNGEFDVIIPFGAATEFISIAATCGLYLSRRTNIRDSIAKPFKRSLLAFTKCSADTEYSELCLRGTDNMYSEAYKELTDDFYLSV